MATTRRQVNALLAALRKEGMVARGSFMCCAGCATAAIDTPENRGKPSVLFHKQEAERAYGTGRERGNVVRSPIHLIYGIVGGQMDSPATVEVGRRIVATAERIGVPVEWNGDPALCVKIMPEAVAT